MSQRLVIGYGFLGRRIAALWKAQGHHVYATTRNPPKASGLRLKGLEPICCDVLDRDSLHLLPKVQTAVFCVGLDRTSGRSLEEVYVHGLENVLDFLPVPDRFLYVSSTGVYGQTGGEEVDEDSPTGPLEESGRVVLKAEILLHHRNPQAISLRFAGIYGPDRLLRIAALQAGEPMVGDPDRWLNLIHVEDGARAVLAAGERAKTGRIYNVCDDCPVSRRDFYTLLARLVGAPQPHFIPFRPEESLPHRELNSRRISNRRLRVELQAVLDYPSYVEGLPACIMPDH
jgi:nucleoside-diphosphate-sugar epimerase